MFQRIRNVKRILAELILGSSYKLTAELDCCKSVKAIKYKPRGLGVT
jgi:hypothetical protein